MVDHEHTPDRESMPSSPEAGFPAFEPRGSEEDYGPLFLRYLHGNASSAEIERIRDALRSDPVKRDYFVELCHLEGQLSDLNTADNLLEALNKLTSSVVVGESNRVGGKIFRSSSLLVLAASLFFLAAVTALLVFRQSTDGPGTLAEESAAVQSLNDPTTNALAKITRKIDCVWEDEKWLPGNRSHIFADDALRLDRGIVELVYKNGTVVLVEGPAQFVARSPMKLELGFGAVSVNAAEGVDGFEVTTPASRIVDVGTEFGVSVSQTGNTRLSVYDGEVLLDKAVGSGSEDPLLLTEKTSLDSKSEAKKNYNVTVIDGALTQRSLDINEGVVVPELPSTNDLVLWLSAEAGVHTDRSNRVVGWADLLAGDNQEEESAWQVQVRNRPTWIEDGLQGRPTVRFDGETNYLTTRPLTTTNEQTVTALVQVLGAGHRVAIWRANQIVNYAGPPSIVLRYNWKRAQFAGKAFVGYYPESKGRDAWVNVGRILGQYDKSQVSSLSRKPQICTYMYSKRQNQAKLFVDGHLVGQAKAPGDIALTSSKVIGAHRSGEDAFFKGSLSELIIHNDSLKDEEIELLHQSIAQRYGLELSQELDL